MPRPKLIELDPIISLADQLTGESSPVTLINIFHVLPNDVNQLLIAWNNDAIVMKRQSGFISAQLHRGIAGSSTFLNYAVWESIAHYREAFSNPQFQASLSDYPDSVTISPHLFQKVAVPGICLG